MHGAGHHHGHHGHHQHHQHQHHDQNPEAQAYDYAAYQSPGGGGGGGGVAAEFIAQQSPAIAVAPGAASVPGTVAAAAAIGLSFNTGQNPHIPPAMPLETFVTHAPITTPIAMPHPDEGKKRKRFTNEEKEAVKKGVEQYGPGDWKSIKNHYLGILHHRTPVQIKDCFRTMVKRGEVPENWGQDAKEARKAARKAGKLFGFYNPPPEATAAVDAETNTNPPTAGATYSSSDKKPKRRKFSKEEKQALVDGIEKLGVGNWKQIREEYSDIFVDRTGLQLKDLYRTMVRLGQIPKVEESEESKVERKKRCAQAARDAKAKKKTMLDKHFTTNARSAEAAAKAASSSRKAESAVVAETVETNNTAQAYPQPMWMNPHQQPPGYPAGYPQHHQNYAYGGYYNFDQGAYHPAAYAGYQPNQQPQQPNQQQSAQQEVEASYYHWTVLWPKLAERGWTKLRANSQQRNDLQVEYIFVLPGHNPRHGVHGTDYFASEDEVVDYVKREHDKQRAENERGDNDAAVAATEVLVEAGEDPVQGTSAEESLEI